MRCRIFQRAIIESMQRGGLAIVHLQDFPTHRVVVYPCGQMRKQQITLSPGDAITVELSPYDLTRGRVIWRHSE